MKQKTITITDEEAFAQGLNDLSVSDREYILVEHLNVNTGTNWFDIRPYTGTGVSGNMNSSIKRLHGWRGTTNNVSVTAHGVRRIVKSVRLKSGDAVRVTLGQDLYPDIP